MKEFTGQRSDAVDKYQITSDAQHQKMSNIISGNNPDEGNVVSVEPKKCPKEGRNTIEISVKNSNHVNELGRSCTRQNVNLNDTQGLGILLNDILSG